MTLRIVAFNYFGREWKKNWMKLGRPSGNLGLWSFLGMQFLHAIFFSIHSLKSIPWWIKLTLEKWRVRFPPSKEFLFLINSETLLFYCVCCKFSKTFLKLNWPIKCCCKYAQKATATTKNEFLWRYCIYWIQKNIYRHLFKVMKIWGGIFFLFL